MTFAEHAYECSGVGCGKAARAFHNPEGWIQILNFDYEPSDAFAEALDAQS